MEWEQVGAIGEIIGGAGVIASLVYLAVQIRQNSRTSRAEAVQAIQQSMVDIGMAMAADPSWGAIFEKSAHTFLDLSPEEKSRVGWLWFSVMRCTETLYHHFLAGNADETIWMSHLGAVRTNLSNEAFRQWWRANTYPFTAEFTDLVEAEMEQIERAGTQYRWFGNAEAQAVQDRG